MNIQDVEQLVVPVLKKHGIIRAGLFGSIIRGEMQDSSDIDVLVELPHTVHGFDYISLKTELQEELESTLGKKVDIVEYNLIKPALKKYILPTQIQIL